MSAAERTRRISVGLEEPLFAWAEQQADASGLSLSAFIRDCVFLARHRQEEQQRKQAGHPDPS
jgi:hypothetical protein